MSSDTVSAHVHFASTEFHSGGLGPIQTGDLFGIRGDPLEIHSGGLGGVSGGVVGTREA